MTPAQRRGLMTTKGSAVREGDEIVIRVPVDAVIERLELGKKYMKVEVTDSAVFMAEIVEDLNDDPVGMIAEAANMLIQEYYEERLSVPGSRTAELYGYTTFYMTP